MPSKWVLAGLVVGCLLLAHPLVGNGPGADTRYSYSTTEIDLTNSERVEALYHVPSVTYGTGTQVHAVMEARNSTYTRLKSAVSPKLRDLVDTWYLADDVHDQYYRVDAYVTDGEFRLRSGTVTENQIVEEIAVNPATADPVVWEILDGQRTASKRVNATVVKRDGHYLLIRPTQTNRVSDPLAIVKVAGYALGIALVIGALVYERRTHESEKSR